MAKLSISIPDDLWHEAKSLVDDETPSSQLLQSALSEWVAQRRRGAAFEAAFEPDKRRLLEIAANLGASYDREFASGYDDALKIAEWVGYEAVAQYVRFRDWDLVFQLAPEERYTKADGTIAVRAVGDPVPSFWDAVLGDEDTPVDEVYAEGADRAFRDLWDALRGGEWRSPGTSPESPEDHH
jgi:hypothetical protein